MQKWTRFAALLAVAAVLLFVLAIALLRSSTAGSVGGVALLGSPACAVAGVVVAGVALARKEPRRAATWALGVNGLLALLAILFLVALVEAIRNFT